jgi:hypothetical protein
MQTQGRILLDTGRGVLLMLTSKEASVYAFESNDTTHLLVPPPRHSGLSHYTIGQKARICALGYCFCVNKGAGRGEGLYSYEHFPIFATFLIFFPSPLPSHSHPLSGHVREVVCGQEEYSG